MSKIANKQVICDVLLDAAKEDKEVMVLCSDSRGSASLSPFADELPEQFVEVGIAEQNLVSIAAGLSRFLRNGFRSWAFLETVMGLYLDRTAGKREN